MKKNITHILLGREKKITEDETILQPLPHKDFRFANPFIVIHHGGPKSIPPGHKERIHPHPHRGFSPFTFMIQGEGFHRDNAGNDEVIKAGGVQWMFAGKGVLHSEGPTPELLASGGTHEFIQLWINAPAARKWEDPFYQAANKEDLPKVLVKEGVEFRLASGSYEGKTGPIQQFTPIVSMIGEVERAAEVKLEATPGYWTLLYVAKGSIEVNGSTVTQHNLVVLDKENTDVEVLALEDTQLLFLSAEPIEEPVAAKDNFVMNTAEEVEQAIEDAKNGKYGTLSY